MPYVAECRRNDIDLHGVMPQTVGELTYVFYKGALEYLPREPRYADYAEVLAAFEAAKLEFYRRHVAPYENLAIQRNGDVE